MPLKSPQGGVIFLSVQGDLLISAKVFPFMIIHGDKRCVKIAAFGLFFLVNVSLPSAHAEIKGIKVDDKKDYARITIYTDDSVSYKVESSGGKEIILKTDDGEKIKDSLSSIKFSSRYISGVEAYKGKGGKSHLRITLFNKLALMSEFFLKAPSRIEMNIKAAPLERIKGEASQAVKVAKSKNRGEDPVLPPPGAVTPSPDKKPVTPNLLDRLEGFEDLITPPIEKFVEIFDTETPLSAYHIPFPPEEKLKAFPSFFKKSGEYELKDELLKKALEYLERGDYEGSLNFLKSAPQNVQKKETYEFLKADTLFQKSLHEGEIGDAVYNYLDLTISYPMSKNIPWAWMQIGRARLKLKTYTGAAEAFEKVLNKFPDSPYKVEARIELARSIAGKGEREKALQLLKDVVENNPSSPLMAKAIFAAAENMGHLGRYKKAGTLFEKALKIWPDYPLGDPDNLMMIGESFYHMKRFDDAARYFNKLVNIYPAYRQGDRAMGRVGDIYFHRGNMKSAGEVYKETESRYPGSDGALIGMIRRADLLDSEGANEGLIMELYRQVYEKYTENALAEVAMLKAGLFLIHRENYLKAFELFESFMSLYPKSSLQNSVFSGIVKTFTLLMEENYKSGNCLELIRMTENNEKLLNALKEKKHIFQGIGACYFKYGQYGKASRIYERIKSGPQLEEARFNIGKAAYMNGDMEKAVKAIEAFRKSFPESRREKEALYLLAKGNDRLGKADKAAVFYREFLEMEKKVKPRAEALISLAGNLRKTGRNLGAVKAYREGIKLHPPEDMESLARAYFLLAESLFEAGQLRQAMTAFNMVNKESSPDLYRQAAYKATLCLEILGERGKAEKVLQEISLTGGGPFWTGLYDAKLEDIRWQAAND